MQERVLHYHVSRFRFLSRYISILILIMIGLAAYKMNYSFLTYAAPITIAVLGIIVFEFKVRSNNINVGQDSIAIKSGFLSKNSTQINHRSISDIRIKQSAFQRMLGYGDIEIGVPGSSLTQHFSGRGDIKVEGFGGMNSGIVLRKFQNVKSIENNISSRIPRR